MLFANRVSNLKPSPTLSISAKAGKMKAEGIDIINLSLGEPDFNTPPEACEFAINAIKQGKTKYTAVDGTASLKKAIQQKFAKENELSFELDEIFVSSGAKQGIFNAFACSLNMGDEVIIPAPYWVSYSEIVEIFEGKPVIVKTAVENEFKITTKELESAITPKTKWLLLNSPSNPTGSVYLAEELLEIAKVLRENKHVFVMSDDIYEHLVFDGLSFKNILNIAPDLAERVLIINGVSKSYSMTGFRIGFGAMKNKAFIKSIVNLQSQSTSNACSISQEATLGALSHSFSFISFMRERMEKRRDFVYNSLKEMPFLEVIKPRGAFYVFFGISGLYGKKTAEGKVLSNDEEVAEYLLLNAKVATVFGSAFGYPNFIRISYALDEKDLEKAMERIKTAISLLA